MLKKSAGTLTQTWGEGLIGYIGIGAVNSIVLIFSFAFIGGARRLFPRNCTISGCSGS